jgi:hypothetical protein
MKTPFIKAVTKISPAFHLICFFITFSFWVFLHIPRKGGLSVILPGIYDEWALKLKSDFQKQFIQIAEKISQYHTERNKYLKADEYMELVMD